MMIMKSGIYTCLLGLPCLRTLLRCPDRPGPLCCCLKTPSGKRWIHHIQSAVIRNHKSFHNGNIIIQHTFRIPQSHQSYPPVIVSCQLPFRRNQILFQLRNQQVIPKESDISNNQNFGQQFIYILSPHLDVGSQIHGHARIREYMTGATTIEDDDVTSLMKHEQRPLTISPTIKSTITMLFLLSTKTTNFM